ncbi:MAG: malonyl-CoA decarboxylase family protein [Elusimicrobiota bacterium]
MPDSINHLNLKALKNSFKHLLSGSKEHTAEKTAYIIAHLSSTETYNKKYLDEFLEFYNKSPKNQLAFFSAIAQSEQYLIFAIFNKIFALTDNPQMLLDLRTDLKQILRQKNPGITAERHKALKNLDLIFRQYLETIFNYQYLLLDEHNADNTPLNLLKFIAEKEGVHPAEHFANFEYRLNSPDRLVLSLSHFKLEKSPIVYIEIALSKKVIRDIHEILSPKHQIEDPEKCRTAVFYSVNKCVNGLSGVKLGEKMILKAVEYLHTHYPKLKNFMTLSPVPGFTEYLKKLINNDPDLTIPLNKLGSQVLPHKDIIREIDTYFDRKYSKKTTGISGTISHLIHDTSWIADKKARSLVSPLIFGLSRNYLLAEKRHLPNIDTASDPVENFHLNNGGELRYINVFSNLSEKGIKESLGTMVNYSYTLGNIEKNRELYHNGTIIHQV